MLAMPMTVKMMRLLMLCLLLNTASVSAQENLAPVQYNPFVQPHAAGGVSTSRTTALSLPFFEDFTGYTMIPDTAKWEERQVYVNNTMAINPVSRGVATFDALSQYGIPYETMNPFLIRYADSLTAKPIDLSSFTPADSIYLSFFFQPAGNGFAPEKTDSLLLYFRPKYGSRWIKVWSRSDTAVQDFRQVMIPVTDTSYLYSDFQFRFVNKASVGINDDVWNLDYIRMYSGRNKYDTLISDVAYTATPSPILSDYVSMPYRQYLANPVPERAARFQSTIKNNFNSSQNIGAFGYTAQESASGAVLSSGADVNRTIAAGKTSDVVFDTYGSTPAAGTYDRVVFSNKFYLSPVPSDNQQENDTIVGQQVFDNYLAYDDGTAEMSYYLNLFPTLPGKLAIEHHLNQPDTLRGMAIYFGRQVPLASYKYFSIVVYRNIAYGSSTSDDIIYTEENLKPRYQDEVNRFWIYKFKTPVALPAGTFYIGTTQPALSGSDSLYIGLDRNRANGNHLYFNVLNVWSPSLVSGALMMRPLLGTQITDSHIGSAKAGGRSFFSLYPNPANNELNISLNGNSSDVKFEIFNLLGSKVAGGSLISGKHLVDLSSFVPGMYLVRLSDDGKYLGTQKFIKQ